MKMHIKVRHTLSRVIRQLSTRLGGQNNQVDITQDPTKNK